MAPLTRKKKRLHRESLYILPSYCQAYIFSHFESTTELLMYSTVCKRWNHIINSFPLVWAFSMVELDPCARLGPAGLASAANALKKKKKNGGWVTLVNQLMRRCCSFGRCTSVGDLWEVEKCRRVCSYHAHSPSSKYIALINERLFDREPSFSVSNESELKAAISRSRFGSTIQLLADITLGDTGDPRDGICLSGIRLESSRRTGKVIFILKLASPYTNILVGDCIIEDMKISGGKQMYSFDQSPDIFPAVEVFRGTSLLMKSVELEAYQGTALMLQGLKAAVYAKNCRIYSQPCLGIVLKQMNHHGLEGSSGEGSILQMSGCFLEGGFMAAHLDGKLDSASKQAILTSDNRFNAKMEDPHEFCRYEYTNCTIQPWRREWVCEAGSV